VAPDLTPEQQAIQDKQDAPDEEDDVRLTAGSAVGGCFAGLGIVAVCTVIGWVIGSFFHSGGGGEFVTNDAPIGGLIGFFVGLLVGGLVAASWGRSG
jgi:hypothetical protein